MTRPPELLRHPRLHPRAALGEELLQLLPGSCEVRRAADPETARDAEAISEAHEAARDEPPS